ncbi:MAG: winged helix-turn-helix domain-containing protein, partial [Candidatus Omnitrophica bacterium]|nr:winged helix-turn-helix domain-containing protein [Candidatus Omnitrophota bacterium]
MIKFKKAYQFKIISTLLSVVFLFHSTVYGIDISNKPRLRPPLGCSSEKGKRRAEQALAAICKMHPVRMKILAVGCKVREGMYDTLAEVLRGRLGEFFAGKRQEAQGDLAILIQATGAAALAQAQRLATSSDYAQPRRVDGTFDFTFGKSPGFMRDFVAEKYGNETFTVAQYSKDWEDVHLGRMPRSTAYLDLKKARKNGWIEEADKRGYYRLTDKGRAAVTNSAVFEVDLRDVAFAERMETFERALNLDERIMGPLSDFAGSDFLDMFVGLIRDVAQGIKSGNVHGFGIEVVYEDNEINFVITCDGEDVEDLWDAMNIDRMRQYVVLDLNGIGPYLEDEGMRLVISIPEENFPCSGPFRISMRDGRLSFEYDSPIPSEIHTPDGL